MPGNTFNQGDRGRSYSGNNYVPSTMRDRATPKRGKILIAIPGRCDHVTHICTERLPEKMGSGTCAASWEADQWVMYWRTNGGRRLAQVLGIDVEARKAEMSREGFAV